MKKTNKFKAIIVSAVSATILASICVTASAASITKANKPVNNGTSQSSSANAVWSMKNCGQDKAKAEKISGIKYAFPEYANYQIYAMKGMIEVRVNINDDQHITFRQSTEKGDITGVYNDYNYKSVNDSRISGVDAKFAAENGRVYAAYWSNGDYGFSLYNENGISQNDAINYVQQLTSAPEIAVQAR